MKLAIIGGGGFRTPFVWQALIRDTGSQRINEVVLFDRDTARLEVMHQILNQLAADFPDAPTLRLTTDLDDAVADSDFLFVALRVGGIEGRQCDEHVALDLNVLGQETTGPGGIAYALRTVPVMMDLAQRVARLAPRAFVINFTNPAGIITEAMQQVLGDRVVGICDTPSGLGRRLARAIGAAPGSVRMDYVGLNHLGWMRRLLVDGKDVLPEILENDAILDSMEEGEVFGKDWIRMLGALPNEYLYYYYFNRDAVRGIISSELTRGDFLAKTQPDFFARASVDHDNAAAIWDAEVNHRRSNYMAEAKGFSQGEAQAGERPREADAAHQGYAGVALAVMAAIGRDEPSTLILNVRNGHTLPQLPASAVIEVPTLVDGSGVNPLATTPLDGHAAGLMQQVKEVEQLAIQAAMTGDPQLAIKAFALHPLVDSVSVARELFAGYRAGLPDLASVFGG